MISELRAGLPTQNKLKGEYIVVIGGISRGEKGETRGEEEEENEHDLASPSPEIF